MQHIEEKHSFACVLVCICNVCVESRHGKFFVAIFAAFYMTVVVVAAAASDVDYLITNSRVLAGGMLLECCTNMVLYAAHTHANMHMNSQIHVQTLSFLIGFIQTQ